MHSNFLLLKQTFLLLRSKFTTTSILVIVLALVFCIDLREEEAISPLDSHSYFPISIDGHELQLQLALTPTEQKKGLMFRERLANDHGMLFLFKQPEQRSFWMRNTRIPLDLAYFDYSGRLKEIYQLFPFDETSVMSNSSEIIIAIETNQNWFSERGIRTGALIDLVALNAALKRRNHADMSIKP